MIVQVKGHELQLATPPTISIVPVLAILAILPNYDSKRIKNVANPKKKYVHITLTTF